MGGLVGKDIRRLGDHQAAGFAAAVERNLAWMGMEYPTRKHVVYITTDVV